MKGHFITVEGPEGSGKTTVLRALREPLESLGYTITATREPGGCPIADAMRAILLDARNTAIVPMAELMLYAAARAQHVNQVILPALDRGEIVLCDRFKDSTVAYQGFGRELELGVIDQLNKLAHPIMPALTLLLDLPVEVGLDRALVRLGDDRKESRFEEEQISFHQRVREGFLEMAKKEPDRFVVIDANRLPKTIADDALDIVLNFLNRSKHERQKK